jgi:hypothetical protein
MVDQTVNARLKRQREVRGTEGWREVKVWVPTDQDAADIRQLAEKRRQRAEALHGLSREVPTVTPEIESRIAKAIAEYGSAAYTTPSGAALTLLTQLAEEDNLTGFSRAFVILARAKPANAKSLAAAVPGKIANYLVTHRHVAPSSFTQWANAHPAWEADLQDAVRDPDRFENVVTSMADGMRSSVSLTEVADLVQ